MYIPSGLQAKSTMEVLSMSSPTSTSQILEPWVMFQRLTRSSDPSLDIKITRSLSKQHDEERMRHGAGVWKSAKVLNEVVGILRSGELGSHTIKATPEDWSWIELITCRKFTTLVQRSHSSLNYRKWLGTISWPSNLMKKTSLPD